MKMKMKTKNNKMILVIRTLILLCILIPLIIFIMDMFNVRIPTITDRYDWLSFIGSYILGFSSLTLAYITVSQNEELKAMNKRLAEDNIKSNGYSDIVFNESQDIEKKDGVYTFRLNLTDRKNRPLNKLIVKEIKMLKYDENKHYLNPYEYFSDILDKAWINKEIELEYTPVKNEDRGFYLARIKVSEDILKVIADKFVKFEIKMSIINSFNLEETGLYSFIFDEIKDEPDFIKLHLYHCFAPNRQIKYIDYKN